ncbi:carbonic anhydrase 1-like isoform X2 [Hydra vulgaris]|uniref:Carbonic anhydrase 1-like isoform X2 n=1 Tax=Hydra vulgaris TaxID=6087 RepID=A0ABM4CSG9_HYDVU
MKKQVFFILIGAGLLITNKALTDINSVGKEPNYGCHSEEKHCIKIINEKREWCYTNDNGFSTKVPCNSDDDCIKTVKCVSYNSVHRNRLSAPPLKALPSSIFSHYSYDDNSSVGPRNWYKIDRSCQSSPDKFQSPINIKTNGITRMEEWRPVIITFPSTSTPFKDAVLENNGNILKLLNIDPSITLQAAGLRNRFLLKEVHFHFGCESDRGSEHQINGKKYPLEVQFLFWDNEHFRSFEYAKSRSRPFNKAGDEDTNRNGLAIVAVLFDEDDLSKTTERFNVLNKAINEIGSEPKGKSTITTNLAEILQTLLPDDIEKGHNYFFKYRGSLTAPPCLETVDWFVLTDCCKLKVPSEFLFTLRQLRTNFNQPSNYELCDNFRPIQERISEEVFW